MKILFTLIFSALLFGCASIPDNVSDYRKTLTFTKVGEAKLAYLERGPTNGPLPNTGKLLTRARA